MMMPLKAVIDVPHGAYKALEMLTEQGVLGSSIEEVASYLVMRGLDDMQRAGTLAIVTVELEQKPIVAAPPEDLPF